LFREKQDFLALATVFGLLKEGGSGTPGCLPQNRATEWLTNPLTCKKEMQLATLQHPTGKEPKEQLDLPAHFTDRVRETQGGMGTPWRRASR